MKEEKNEIKRQLITIIWKIKRWSGGVRKINRDGYTEDIENFIVQ